MTKPVIFIIVFIVAFAIALFLTWYLPDPFDPKDKYKDDDDND
jgi:hypothetical protein